jgi:hypothetical protein
MLLKMTESVLSDVGHSQVRVLLDLARVWCGITSDKLDEGRFTSTIGSDDTDTG